MFYHYWFDRMQNIFPPWNMVFTDGWAEYLIKIFEDYMNVYELKSMDVDERSYLRLVNVRNNNWKNFIRK